MLALFGCPGLDRIEAAYEEVAGLARGWRELVGLHQLHPLATHASSHGPAYAAQLVETARTFA
jgi:fructosamine-3-kinase